MWSVCEQDLRLHKYLQKSCILRQTLKTKTQKSCFGVATSMPHQILILIMKLTSIDCLQLVSYSRKSEKYSWVTYSKIPFMASIHLHSVTFEVYFPWKEHLVCVKSEGRALLTEWTSCLLKLLWPICAYFMRTDNTLNFNKLTYLQKIVIYPEHNFSRSHKGRDHLELSSCHAIRRI